MVILDLGLDLFFLLFLLLLLIFLSLASYFLHLEEREEGMRVRR
jgi:hypothetical protein